jgi:hypothetical protein
MRSIALMVVCVCACGENGGDGGDGGGGSDAGQLDAPSAAECEPAAAGAPASGVIRIGERRGRRGAGALVDGVVVGDQAWRFSGLAPQLQQETAREGDCVLYEYEPSFCDPPCQGFCVDKECRPFPEYLSAGTLHVGGLGAPVALEPDFLTLFGAEYRGEIEPPAPGQTIQVCASGDDSAGFAAEVTAVEPLDVVLADDLLILRDGDDLVLDWTPSSDANARIRLTLNTDNEHHGLPYPAIIECDAADDGELVVPRALIEAFPPVTAPPAGPVACSGSDCPVSRLIRYRSATINDSQLSVDILAEQAIEFYIGH